MQLVLVFKHLSFVDLKFLLYLVTMPTHLTKGVRRTWQQFPIADLGNCVLVYFPVDIILLNVSKFSGGEK